MFIQDEFGKRHAPALYRGLFYVAGLLILALGLTLNTKAGLGVSAIISVSYCVSIVSGYNFGDTTFVMYVIFVAAEIILHMVREWRYRKTAAPALAHAGRRDWKLVLIMDILQIPLSLVFTRFLNLFADWIPEVGSGGSFSTAELAVRFLMLALAITLTGIGAAMSLNMRVVPNPGDGIVQAIADCVHKSVGFTKNCFDLVNITISITVGLVFTGHLAGVGIGTVFAVIGVGRVIAVFNHLTEQKMMELTEMND